MIRIIQDLAFSLEEEDVESDISLFMEESADKEYSSESDTGDYSGYACEPKHSHEELKKLYVRSRLLYVVRRKLNSAVDLQ